jgi:hypothetical protein
MDGDSGIKESCHSDRALRELDSFTSPSFGLLQVSLIIGITIVIFLIAEQLLGSNQFSANPSCDLLSKQSLFVSRLALPIVLLCPSSIYFCSAITVNYDLYPHNHALSTTLDFLSFNPCFSRQRQTQPTCRLAPTTSHHTYTTGEPSSEDWTWRCGILDRKNGRSVRQGNRPRIR